MVEQDDEKLILEEKFSSLNEEVTSKTKKLKKLWSKYQQAKSELKDLEHEFIDEKNELLESVRDLTKQLKLKAFIIAKFIPQKVRNVGRNYLRFSLPFNPPLSAESRCCSFHLSMPSCMTASRTAVGRCGMKPKKSGRSQISKSREAK